MKKNVLLSRISKFKPINLSNHMNKIKIFIKKKKKKFNNKNNNKTTTLRIKELRKSTTSAPVNLLTSPPCNSSSSYNEEVKFFVDKDKDEDANDEDDDDDDDDDDDNDDNDDNDDDNEDNYDEDDEDVIIPNTITKDVIIPNTITKDVVVTDEDDDIIINSKCINTIKYYIYSISDKNNSNESYIGSTQHFVDRKSKHKKNVKNTRGKNYWCKLYKYIRRNGGWNNFDMVQLECGSTYSTGNIKDIEQSFIDQYKPTLNSKQASKRLHINVLRGKQKKKQYNVTDNSNIVSPIAPTRINNDLISSTVSFYHIKHQIEDIKKYGKTTFSSQNLTTDTSPRKTRNRAANLYIEINEDIEKDLIKSSVLQYVCKSDQSKNAFIQQTLQFLSWVFENYNLKKNMMLLNIIKFIIKNTTILDDWYSFLRDKQMAFDTIRGRFNNISILYQLFNSSILSVKDNAVQKLIDHCRLITRKCEFEIIDALSKVSTDDYIKQGLLPKNLKTDLLHMWNTLLPLINNIIQLSKTVTLTKGFYSLVLKCILFGFWAENANGRMRAVISMNMEQYKQMCKSNYNSSSETKSLKQHGRQLVSLCSNSDLLVYLKMYVKHVRSQIKCDQSNKENVFLK